MTRIIDAQSFEAEVLENEGVVLVDFFAEWCGPCKMMAPILDQLSDEYAGQATIAKLDIDTNPEISDRYRISAVPTLLIFKNGEKVDTIVGFQPKQSLELRLKAQL